MSDSFVKTEDGQALVIAGLAMFVLVAALALAVDWGYGYAARRGAQNEADSAALAAGRLLASSYVGGSQPFDATRETVWCEALRARNANQPGSAATTTASLSVSFSPDGSSWTAISSADCAAAGTTDVPSDTVLVRVQSSHTYRSLFGGIVRQQQQVTASARAQLTAAGGTGDGAGVWRLHIPSPEDAGAGVGVSGFTTEPNGAIWPVARHFAASDFATPCGQSCDPRTVVPTTMWPAPTSQRFGAFRGLLSFAHFSTREVPPQPHQLVTESDYTGTGNGHHGHPSTPRLVNHSDPAVCGGALWDTNGTTNLTDAANCDVPNWFYYGYRGSLSVGTDWADPAWTLFEMQPATAELPDPLDPSRASCAWASTRPYVSAPSCTATPSLRGDWVETVNGEVTANMAGRMREFIARYGRTVPFSSAVVSGHTLGKAVVVHVFLWDCSEHYTGTSGNRWDLMVPRRGGDDEDDPDCSLIRPRDPRGTSVDRVHLFTVVPFTFYEGLVQASPSVSVQAYWGDAFGDAGGCSTSPVPAACDLNPLMNSAFLVPDE